MHPGHSVFNNSYVFWWPNSQSWDKHVGPCSFRKLCKTNCTCTLCVCVLCDLEVADKDEFRFLAHYPCNSDLRKHLFEKFMQRTLTYLYTLTYDSLEIYVLTRFAENAWMLWQKTFFKCGFIGIFFKCAQHKSVGTCIRNHYTHVLILLVSCKPKWVGHN